MCAGKPQRLRNGWLPAARRYPLADPTVLMQEENQGMGVIPTMIQVQGSLTHPLEAMYIPKRMIRGTTQAMI